MSEPDTKSSNLMGWFRVFNQEGMRTQDHANERRTNALCITWVVCLMVCGSVTQFGLVHGPLVWALGLVPIIPGTLFVHAYLKLLREADEMLRKIQLEALAIGFGAGFVCGISVMNLMPPGVAWSLGVLIPMVMGYVARVLWAARENNQ